MSAFPPRFFSTPSLSSTFAPPEMRTKGRSTSPRSLPSSVSSRSSRRPAYAGSSCATPTVEAWARCTDPNASWTKRSLPSASSLREPGVVLRLTRVEAGVLEHVQPVVGKSCCRRSATGCSENAGSSSLGSPQMRADGDFLRIASRSSRRVGSDAWMRVSSAIRPSSSGTFRSERTSTRLPPTSASRTDRGRCTYAETVAGMSAEIFVTTSTSRQL